MKPAWDQLSEEFKTSKHAGVYDVDCTAEGKDLCEKIGVSGYPTIKYGDASSLENLKDYSGGRDFEALKKFAEENLGPVCGPKDLDACDEMERALVERFLGMHVAELDSEIGKLDKDFSARQKKFAKKKRKFDEKYKEFKDELKDHKSDLKAHEKTGKKLEQNVKATKAEKDKFAKQTKKMSDLSAKFDKKEVDIESEKAVFDKEQGDLDAEIKTSGLKYMKIVRTQKKKDEL